MQGQQDQSGSEGSKKPPTARPVIQLPSFREVQAAQRPAKAPNFFQGSGSSQLSNNAQGNPAISLPAGPPSRPTGTAQQSSAQPFALQSRPQAPSQPNAGAHDAPNRLQQGSHAQHQPSYAQPGPAAYSSVPSSNHLPQASMQQTAGPLQHFQANPNAIQVSNRQKGNPILKHIVNVRKEFADIVPDYLIGANTCALFLSLRYHLLKPDYIHYRIRELQRSFTLRILLCHVDVDDVVEPLQQVTRAAIASQLSLVCAWSELECARYLETFKAFESKPADLIQGRADEDYLSRLNAAVTTVRGVNRTDVLTLGATFHTAAGIMQASMEDLSSCPGIGPTKIRRLFDAFHEPFRKQLNSQQQTGMQPASAQGSGELSRKAGAGLAPDLVALNSDDEADDADFS